MATAGVSAGRRSAPWWTRAAVRSRAWAHAHQFPRPTCRRPPALSRAPQIVNPKPFLMDLVGKPVLVKLKWGMEYKGA
jgi:hypothetical protein